MIRITINDTDYQRIMNALTAMEKEASNSIDRLLFKGALGYRDSLQKQITTQSFLYGSYAALTTAYAVWKTAHVGHENFWELWGAMFGSLHVWKTDSSDWISGIPENAKDSRGRNISIYAGANEKLRPLFEPTGKDYADNQWQKQCKDALRNIVKSWA